MYLLNKQSATDVFNRMRTRISQSPGFEKYGAHSRQMNTILNIISEEFGAVYNTMDLNMDQMVLSKASGFYLDLFAPHGLDRSVVSYGAVSCQAKNIKLSVSDGVLYDYLKSGSSDNYMTIPPGVVLETSDPDLSVVTNEYTAFGPNDNEIYLGVSVDYSGVTDEDVATIPPGTVIGVDLNQIANAGGSDSLFKTGDQDKFSVTNTNTFAVGTEVEKDDSFRIRISEYHTASATGNDSAIRSIAFGYPDVKDVKFRRFTQGTGSFDVLLIPTNDTVSRQTILNIEAEIAPVVADGQRYRVMEPGYVYLAIRFTSAATRPSIIQAKLQSYIGGISPGGVFNKVEVEDLIRSETGDGSFSILTTKFNGMLSKTGIITLDETQIFRAPLEDMVDA